MSHGDFQRLTREGFYPLTAQPSSQVLAEVAATVASQRSKCICPGWGRAEKQGLWKGEEKPHKHPHLLYSHIRLQLSVCVTHGSDDWEKVIHGVTPELCRWQVQTHDPAQLQFLSKANLIPNAFNTACHSVPRVM